MKTKKNIFQSFMMGGFECCDMLNRYGNRVDLLKDTGHLEHIEQDYEHLKEYHISTVREGIRWSVVEPSPYQYNWEPVKKMLQAGKNAGVQQVWDLCHFGLPADLSPLHPQFVPRFIGICLSFLKIYREILPQDHLIVTPVNEVSFLSWLGGEVGATTPYTKGYGWEVKYAYVRAYIEAVKAMKAADFNMSVMSTEPLVDIVPPLYTDIYDTKYIILHEDQYQVTDMLWGRICPELGGNEDIVDIIGYNFYYNNRFSLDPHETLSWTNEFNDPRFRPFHEILLEGYERYEKPVVLSETSHPAEHRGEWLDHILEETAIAMQEGVPLMGICWYPVLDRPDWDETDFWHESGIWNKKDREGSIRGIEHKPLLERLEKLKSQIQLTTNNLYS